MPNFALLENVREFMRQQSTTFHRQWIIASGFKNDVFTHGIGQGVHRRGRLRCICVGMNSNPAEIVTEARLEKRPCRWVEWLAG
jgi:hypothetical protein